MIGIIITSIIAVLVLIVSVITLRENIITRKTSFRPMLIPGRITEFVNDDNLFSCNFEYPSTDILGEPKLVYFGIET